MPHTIEFSVAHGDIASFSADAVVLKFAHQFYGPDKAVASAISDQIARLDDLYPAVGSYRFTETKGAVAAPYALFIGVVSLDEFRYEQVRDFAVAALRALAAEAPGVRHVAMPVHGTGYGLDENEAILSELAGCLEAVFNNEAPAGLQSISFVEIKPERVERFGKAVQAYMEKAGYVVKETGPERWTYSVTLPDQPGNELATVARTILPAEQPGLDSETKPHAFIAMPFKKEMEDIYYYGIQQPVHAAGLLSERVDKTAFTGGIMEYVKNRIETAAVVIAELTSANPNVYLEVGYAWGNDRPTILIVSDEKELQFDVRGQKCLTYSSIKELEMALRSELKGMIAKGIIKL